MWILFETYLLMVILYLATVFQFLLEIVFLNSIILDFKETMGLPKVCGAIDGTHIMLSKSPNRRVTLAASNFYNKKKFNSIVLQAFCDSRKILWNACAAQLGEVHDGGQFKVSSLYKDLRTRVILQEPKVLVGDV